MNDDLFEDVPYQDGSKFEAAPSDDALFEDTPHPETNSSISAGRAALVGAGQGATFGFADEITAPFVAGAGMLSGLPDESPDESTYEKYKRLMQTYRDVAREEQDVAQKEQPGAYTTGAVAGGLLAPGLGAMKVAKSVKDAGLIAKTVAGAGTGAVMGGLAGAGEAEGGLDERIEGFKEGAPIGAAVGGAIPMAGATLGLVKAGVGKLAELPVVRPALEALKRGAKGENLITEVGRKESGNILSSEGGNFFSDIKNIQKEAGSKIADKIDEASNAGEQVDLTDEVGEVLDKLKKIKAEGSKEAASYASSVEGEIKKILGIKPEAAVDDLSKLDFPEGLSPSSLKPKVAEEAEQILVDPKKAQDLKQVLSDYSPRKGMAPQEIAPAGATKEFKNVVSEKLNEVTGLNEPTVNLAGAEGPSLNKQYGLIKDSLKRLAVNEKKLPEQIKEKIFNITSKLGNEDLSGDNARKLIEDVLANIEQVAPEIAQKYRASFTDMAGRLKLSQEISKGFKNVLGTVPSTIKASANIAGLVANKTGLATAGKVVGQGIETLAEVATKSPLANKGIVTYNTQSSSAVQGLKKALEPHALQRQVAQYAEKADPAVLKEQAESIRSTYGKEGEQLATILNNMADKDVNARRALMFTILQNPNHRKMLGLTKEEVK